METSDRLSKEDELRAANALKTLNLELNYQAETFIHDEAPPDVVSQWLDNITRFEEANANAQLTPLSKIIGNPEPLPSEGLDEAASEAEINRLLLLLFENNIYVNRPEGVSATDYYRFLVEDFLQLEIPDIKLPGMLHVFCYEEFFADDEED